MKLDGVVSELKALRVSKGLTLDEVAKAAGWANASIPARIEARDSNPTLRSLQRYAEAVGARDFRLSLRSSSPTVLTFFNHAGGVGKTSAVRDIGYTLMQMGFRVLLIDADPQASLTRWLGAFNDIKLDDTLYSAVLGEEDDLRLPQPHHVYGMDLIPSQMGLAKVDLQLPGVMMGLTRLKEALVQSQGYDFILIDPPPSLGSLAALASIAATHLVVPVPTNNKGVEGIPTVMDAVKQFRRATPKLQLALFLVSQYDARTTVDQDSLVYLSERLKALAPVSTPLRLRPGAYKRAALQGQPIPVYEPSGKAAEEIQTVTTELLTALGVNVHVEK
ncbi:MAG: Chromosome (plasmid) partitioning protein ParA [uncultured Chloroflexia bacterium]|uniref:Chromosome (Plasmid) partitioning protein ParA n=1 Tax=uncultured Chloroflexia bacterium TaxID=1672391 RepID=A0A6J4N8F2_9CHLR|nr:MAG: Chromosome (plasmid) partitioning protein ParA [uncultured Chloroflexia bacterium]